MMRALRAVLGAALAMLLSGSVIAVYAPVQSDKARVIDHKVQLSSTEATTRAATANRPGATLSATVATRFTVHAWGDDLCTGSSRDAADRDGGNDHCCGLDCHTSVRGRTDDAWVNRPPTSVAVAEPSSLHGNKPGATGTTSTSCLSQSSYREGQDARL